MGHVSFFYRRSINDTNQPKSLLYLLAKRILRGNVLKPKRGKALPGFATYRQHFHLKMLHLCAHGGNMIAKNPATLFIFKHKKNRMKPKIWWKSPQIKIVGHEILMSATRLIIRYGLSHFILAHALLVHFF